MVTIERRAGRAPPSVGRLTTAAQQRRTAGHTTTTRHRSGEGGFASLTLPMLLWLATIIAIVVIDLGGYLVAASRAQTLADNAALAAVSAGVGGTAGGGPSGEANALVERGGGRLESCRCPPRAETAEVTVSVPIPGLVMPSLGAGRMEADASAVLAPAGG